MGHCVDHCTCFRNNYFHVLFLSNAHVIKLLIYPSHFRLFSTGKLPNSFLDFEKGMSIFNVSHASMLLTKSDLSSFYFQLLLPGRLLINSDMASIMRQKYEGHSDTPNGGIDETRT